MGRPPDRRPRAHAAGRPAAGRDGAGKAAPPPTTPPCKTRGTARPPRKRRRLPPRGRRRARRGAPVVRENFIFRLHGARVTTCPPPLTASNPCSCRVGPRGPCQPRPRSLRHWVRGARVPRPSGAVRAGPATLRASSRGAGHQGWAERSGEHVGRLDTSAPPVQAAPGVPGCPSILGEAENCCSSC